MPGARSGRIRALVLLAGSLRSTSFISAIGRSPLDLPVLGGRTVGDVWQEAAGDLVGRLGLKQLNVRVLLHRDAPEPMGGIRGEAIRLSIERDPAEYRGTGGVLRDACGGYGDEDWVLVANAAQIPVGSYGELAELMLSAPGDACLLAGEDGTPGGLMLMRCGCLRLVPELGFVDLKEQAMPAIVAKHRVDVVRHSPMPGLSIRTLPDYIGALRRLKKDGRIVEDGRAYAEDCYPTFGLVEEGANVDPSACIHDSVVLRGGSVGRGATLVRSVVCAGGVVRRGRMVVDEIVSPRGKERGA